jgi:hypothetical protein
MFFINLESKNQSTSHPKQLRKRLGMFVYSFYLAMSLLVLIHQDFRVFLVACIK